MKIKALREKLCMNIKEVSEFLHIPYRTWQNWEYGERKITGWVEKFIVYKLEHEIKNLNVK